MSTDLTVPSETSKNRVAYAATVAELQLETARDLATKMTNQTAYFGEPLVMALFNAIVANYGAMTTRPRD